MLPKIDGLSLLKQFRESGGKTPVIILSAKHTVDNVAHDLRTPLTQFRTSAERTLSTKSSSEEYQNALLECVESSDKILAIINAVMDVSQAETGTLKLNIQEVSPKQLLEEVAELYEFVAEEENVQVKVEC